MKMSCDWRQITFDIQPVSRHGWVVLFSFTLPAA